MTSGQGAALGRPRDPDVDRRIATAAVQLYGEVGWAGFNIEAVARRAGVGKTSVYARWQSRDDLLVAALRTRVGEIAHVDTGFVRTDLIRLVSQFLDLYLGDAGSAAMRLAVEANHIAALNERREALSGSQRRAALAIVDRAIERGELPEGTSGPLLLDALCGATLFRVTITPPQGRDELRERVTAYAEELVDLLLASLLHPAPADKRDRPERSA